MRYHRDIDMSLLRRRVDDVAAELMEADQEIDDHSLRPGWVYEIEDGLGTLYHIDELDGQPTLRWGDLTITGPLEKLELDLAGFVREQLESDNPDDASLVLREPAFYVVCVVLQDRAYGGPEEGGWYYDTTQPCLGGHYPIPVVVKTRDEAEAAADQLYDEWCLERNEGRPSTSSVLSEGRYGTFIYEGDWPECLPKERPHYE